MNHAELSRDLALAIGYAPESVRVRHNTPDDAHVWEACEVFRQGEYDAHPHWHCLDYRDPSVAMPLLKWLITEQEAGASGAASGEAFCIWVRVGKAMRRFAFDTLEEAICKAVIGVGRKP